MVICAVYNCLNHSVRDWHLSYFRFPRIIINKGIRIQEISLRRRHEWILRINRADFGPEKNLEAQRVCSEHFVHGKPSDLMDETNPDWAPSLKLGYTRPEVETRDETKRYTRSEVETRDGTKHRMTCSALGCTNRLTKVKIPGIAFHGFPSNEERRKLWLKALGREDWLPYEHSKVCSKHFTEDMLDRSNPFIRLRPWAVPCIFDTFPPGKEEVSFLNKVTDNNAPASTEETDEEFIEVKPDISSIAINNTASLDSEQTICNSTEENTLPIFKEEMESGTDTNSDEDINSVSKNAICNSEKILKQKLDKLTVRYKMSQTRLKQSQRQCKLYLDEITSLRKVINSLRQIISVADESSSDGKS